MRFRSRSCGIEAAIIGVDFIAASLLKGKTQSINNDTQENAAKLNRDPSHAIRNMFHTELVRAHTGKSPPVAATVALFQATRACVFAHVVVLVTVEFAHAVTNFQLPDLAEPAMEWVRSRPAAMRQLSSVFRPGARSAGDP